MNLALSIFISVFLFSPSEVVEQWRKRSDNNPRLQAIVTRCEQSRDRYLEWADEKGIQAPEREVKADELFENCIVALDLFMPQ